MNRASLLRRNLAYHWRAHLAVTLGVIAAGAALTGALLVGDSMRASLRDAALGRLGRVDQVVAGNRFFREALADDLSTDVDSIAPAILLKGAVSHALSRARVNQVGVFGVDQRFWALHGSNSPPVADMPRGSKAILNRALATELGAEVGDPIILRLGNPQQVSIDTLLGRRDRTTTSARLTVAAVIEAADLGAFDLNPRQQTPKNLFVPLDALQRILIQPAKANTLLIETNHADVESLQRTLAAHLTLPDLGLSLRADEEQGYVALESDAFLIAPPLEAAARDAAQRIDAPIEPVFAYLANSIIAGDKSIPYSTVAAIDPDAPTAAKMLTAVDPPAHLATGELMLNEWAADALDVQVGARIELEYYLAAPFGRLDSQRAVFTLAGIVALAGAAADAGFTPPYPGVTDVERIADWDPPFPVDFKRLRPEDDAYWENHRTTPKAFITYADGERLWATAHEQHGRCTALRAWPRPDETVASLRDRWRDAINTALSPATAGLAVIDVRATAAQAGRGSTDFSGLFIGFSFFLIMSAVLLVALLFRLGVERRAREVGLLLATGFHPRRATGLLLAEGGVIAAIGAVLGLLAGCAYAQLMLTGLRTWWSAAVNAPFLRFAGATQSYAIGLLATAAIALPALVWGIRNLRRQPATRLLAGATETSGIRPTHHTPAAPITALAALVAAIALITATYFTQAVSAPIAFFGSGTAMLVAGIATAATLLRRPLAATLSRPMAATQNTPPFQGSVSDADQGGRMQEDALPRPAPADRGGRAGGGWNGTEHQPPSRTSNYMACRRPRALAQLGLRNAPRHPGRSLLIIALIASATFVTTAIQAFRLAPDEVHHTMQSGSGGFALIAESITPLPYDLNAPDGREALNLSAGTQKLLERAICMPFRLRPGDSASCLNLFVPTDPRILGVSCAMIHRGGFNFSKSQAGTDEERDNPWRLLERELPDGVTPAIGDEASVLWQLHSGLGQRITITDQSGRARALEFVALLKGSVLQSELLIHEDHFRQMFPALAGHAFFLVETTVSNPAQIAEQLEADLEPYGMDVVSTRDRLRDLFAVQNTYLSTFQALGGLGVLLGSVGLIAVMLRNVWERRTELALMQALGFSPRAIAGVVLAENAALILAGLAIGIVSALVAIAPRIAEDPAGIAWGTMLLLAAGIPTVGIGAAAAVLAAALRAPLLPALRRE
jgi:ABC-type antimicrobial peptide transport system permease subunit